MVVQGIALLAISRTQEVAAWSGGLIALGIGTALVYPTLLAAVGDIARPSWRGVAVGVYRLWRDLGYVAGALLAGVVADLFGVPVAIGTVGIITIMSGLLVALRFEESRTGGGA
jgi:MFS family permease